MTIYVQIKQNLFNLNCYKTSHILFFYYTAEFWDIFQKLQNVRETYDQGKYPKL